MCHIVGEKDSVDSARGLSKKIITGYSKWTTDKEIKDAINGLI